MKLGGSWDIWERCWEISYCMPDRWLHRIRHDYRTLDFIFILKCMVNTVEMLVYIYWWLIAVWFTDNTSWNASGGCMRRHWLQHYGTCANFCAATNFNIAEDFCACANYYTFTNFWVTVTTRFTCTAKRYRLQNWYVVFNYCCFTYNDARGVVEHNATANFCCWVNIDLERYRNLVLQKDC